MKRKICGLAATASPAILCAIVCVALALHDAHRPRPAPKRDWPHLSYEPVRLHRHGRLPGLAQMLLASRNPSGTFSLAAGNPVVSGTTISSTWANGTLSDIATEITNSLDRNGRGAMLAPLQLVSGTQAAPGLVFASSLSAGWYWNAGFGEWDFAAGSTDLMLIGAGGVTIEGGTLPLQVLGSGGAQPAAKISQQNANLNALQILGCNTGGGCTAPALSVSAGAGTSGAIIAQGGGTGIGIVASNGTAATGGTRQTAMQLTNGDLSFSGTVNPSIGTSLVNVLTPASIVKAYGFFSCPGGNNSTCTGTGGLVQGMNASGTALNGQGDCINAGSKPFRVTLAGAMAAKGYAVLVSPSGDGSGSNPAMLYVNSNATNATASQFDICGNTAVAGGAYSFYGSGGGGSFVVVGFQ